MEREVTNSRSSDMVVIVGGRSGTLGEFSIVYDEGKLIYQGDHEKLVGRLITLYEEKHFRKPSCFCSDSGFYAYTLDY